MSKIKTIDAGMFVSEMDENRDSIVKLIKANADIAKIIVSGIEIVK